MGAGNLVTRYELGILALEENRVCGNTLTCANTQAACTATVTAPDPGNPSSGGRAVSAVGVLGPGWARGCRPGCGPPRLSPNLWCAGWLVRAGKTPSCSLKMCSRSTASVPVSLSGQAGSSGGPATPGEHGIDAPVLSGQGGYLVGELRCQRGEQALVLDPDVRAEHGGDLPGQVRHLRQVSVGPGCPHLADQAEYQLVFPGQLIDRGQGLAAADVDAAGDGGRTVSFARRPASACADHNFYNRVR